MNDDLRDFHDDMRGFRRAWRHRRRHSIFTGFLVILIGLALLADHLGYPGVHRLWRQWPLLLIALGASKLWDRPFSLGAQAILLTGVYFELRHLGHDLSYLHPWWPLLIVWAGFMLTLRALRPLPHAPECSHDR
ncbi:MAG TPA: DUF5668 domain-containing protein [Holophagaceae bacterium]|nr:DUF5668 domain-containing protein [Holophagaceae bacterium]